MSLFGFGTLTLRIRLLLLKNSFRICPRIDDLDLTFTWMFPLDIRLTEFLLLSPVGFSYLAGSSFYLVWFLDQRSLVIKLIDMSRSEIIERLVRPALIVELDITA